MRISFDLDDTLIVAANCENEERNVLQRILAIEKLRKGTIKLIKILKKDGHEIWIYTTSFRKLIYIRWMFYTYGIQLNGVINQAKHNYRLREKKRYYTKFPPAFKIDLHIDDSKGVLIEGERGGFKILQIEKNEKDWVRQVLDKIKIKSNKS